MDAALLAYHRLETDEAISTTTVGDGGVRKEATQNTPAAVVVCCRMADPRIASANGTFDRTADDIILKSIQGSLMLTNTY